MYKFYRDEFANFIVRSRVCVCVCVCVYGCCNCFLCVPINNITFCSVLSASAVHKFDFYTVTNRTPNAGDKHNVCTFRHAFISTQLKCSDVTLSEQSALSISGVIQGQGNCSSSHFAGLSGAAATLHTFGFVRLFCPVPNVGWRDGADRWRIGGTQWAPNRAVVIMNM
jgi:hypothetical protein